MKSKTLRDTINWLNESGEDEERFLHGYEHGEPHDDEGGMAKSRLLRMKKMAVMLCKLLKDDDQLPAWVQDHLAVAHENLEQVFGYMEPESDLDDEESEEEDSEEEEEDEDDEEEEDSEEEEELNFDEED